jgi:hypothetical protein
MKKVKDYIKKNPKPAKGRFGVNPHDPWSAKYNVAEDLTTKQKSAGDSRSKIAHSPTRQRAAELDKAAKFYQVKTPSGSMHKKEGNQNTALTPEETQMNEAKKKKMSPLEKWRQGFSDREKAHKEFMKSIEPLSHHDQMQAMFDRIKANRASLNKEEVRGELRKIRKKENKIYNKEVDSFNKKVKEIHTEETITELSAKKLLGYMTKAGSKKDTKKDTKDRSSSVMKATGKYLKKIDEEELDVTETWSQKYKKSINCSRPKGFSQKAHCAGRKKRNEETYMDAKAATPAVMSPGEGVSEKMTLAQRLITLKKKKLKEDLYDHEKEDKSVATYGKKPKFEKAEKDNGGENKPQAASVMTGGTTLTGSKRDTIEIDPMMRNRPGQPDVTKKEDKDKDKKKDK